MSLILEMFPHSELSSYGLEPGFVYPALLKERSAKQKDYANKSASFSYSEVEPTREDWLSIPKIDTGLDIPFIKEVHKLEKISSVDDKLEYLDIPWQTDIQRIEASSHILAMCKITDMIASNFNHLIFNLASYERKFTSAITPSYILNNLSITHNGKQGRTLTVAEAINYGRRSMATAMLKFLRFIDIFFLNADTYVSKDSKITLSSKKDDRLLMTLYYASECISRGTIQDIPVVFFNSDSKLEWTWISNIILKEIQVLKNGGTTNLVQIMQQLVGIIYSPYTAYKHLYSKGKTITDDDEPATRLALSFNALLSETSISDDRGVTQHISYASGGTVPCTLLTFKEVRGQFSINSLMEPDEVNSYSFLKQVKENSSSSLKDGVSRKAKFKFGFFSDSPTISESFTEYTSIGIDDEEASNSLSLSRLFVMNNRMTRISVIDRPIKVSESLTAGIHKITKDYSLPLISFKPLNTWDELNKDGKLAFPVDLNDHGYYLMITFRRIGIDIPSDNLIGMPTSIYSAPIMSEALLLFSFTQSASYSDYHELKRALILHKPSSISLKDIDSSRYKGIPLESDHVKEELLRHLNKYLSHLKNYILAL